jgi:hypothetical protein
MKGKYARYAHEHELGATYVDHRLYGPDQAYKDDAALCIANRIVEAAWRSIDIDRWKLEESAEEEDQDRVIKDRQINCAWNDHAREWE